MSNKKQSSIDWLVDQIEKDANVRLRGLNLNKLLEQAKEIHKKEIEDAYIQSMKDNMIAPLDFEVYKPEAEEYYNETFGGNNE